MKLAKISFLLLFLCTIGSNISCASDTCPRFGPAPMNSPRKSPSPTGIRFGCLMASPTYFLTLASRNCVPGESSKHEDRGAAAMAEESDESDYETASTCEENVLKSLSKHFIQPDLEQSPPRTGKTPRSQGERVPRISVGSSHSGNTDDEVHQALSPNRQGFALLVAPMGVMRRYRPDRNLLSRSRSASDLRMFAATVVATTRCEAMSAASQ